MRFIERIESSAPINNTQGKSREFWLEAPSGVEPLHRSFAARLKTLRPMMIQKDRLRRERSKIKEFSHFGCDQSLLN